MSTIHLVPKIRLLSYYLSNLAVLFHSVSLCHFQKKQVSPVILRQFTRERLPTIAAWQSLWFVLGKIEIPRYFGPSHIVFYEKLVAFPLKEYTALADFLGFGSSLIDHKLLQNVVSSTNASSMRKMEKLGILPGGSYGGRIKVRIAGDTQKLAYNHTGGGANESQPNGDLAAFEESCRRVLLSLLPKELLRVWVV